MKRLQKANQKDLKRGLRLDQVHVEFQSRRPHTTCWLRIEYPEGQSPTVLLTDLEQIGFVKDEHPPLPPLKGIATLDLVKDGTDIFNGWTEEERKANVKAVRKALSEFGLQKVAHRKCDDSEFL